MQSKTSQGDARGRVVRAAAAAALTALLAASSFIGGGTASAAPIDRPSAGPSPSAKSQKTPLDIAKPPYCPPLNIRAGTEAISLYDKGHDADPQYVRFVGSIMKTARECHQDGDTLSVKVGVAGRVVSGPKGGAGTVTLPLRIAVTKQISDGKGPLYSKLFTIKVPVGPPSFDADYSQVFDQVNVKVGPEDHDLLIYVGFDEGKAKKSEKTPSQD
jgi:hypothetical protein